MGRIRRHNTRKVVSKLAEHIGNKLLELREAKQVSMREVSAATGISNPAICQTENGQSVPMADTIWKLCKYFDVQPNYFFEGYSD